MWVRRDGLYIPSKSKEKDREKKSMVLLGIDIGTTSIGVCLVRVRQVDYCD